MTMFNITISKIGDVVSFDSTKLPANSMDYLVEYGLKQSVNDAHASVLRKDYDSQLAFETAVRGAANRRIEQIRTGALARTAVHPALVAAAEAGLSADELLAIIAAAAAKKSASKKAAA